MNNTHKSRFLSGFRFKQFTVRQDRCPMKVGSRRRSAGCMAAVRPQDRRMLDIGTGTADRPDAGPARPGGACHGRRHRRCRAGPRERRRFALERKGGVRSMPRAGVRDPGAVRSDRLQPAVFRRLAHLPRSGAHRGRHARAPAVRRPARRRPPPAGSRRPVCRHPSHGRSGAFPRGLCGRLALVRRTDVRTTPRRPVKRR